MKHLNTAIKKLSLLLLCLLFAILAYNQTPCELIKSYSLTVCKGDTRESIKILERFQQLYPTDSLIDDVNLSVAQIYFDKGEMQKSKVVATEIVNKKTTLIKRGFQLCPTFYDSTECRRAIYVVDDVKEIKYKACLLLYKILMKEKDYYKALYFLNLAETDFALFYWCGYSTYNWRVASILNYTMVYESIGAYDKAIDAAAPYILSYPVSDRLVSLLKKYKNFDSIRNSLQNLDHFIYFDYAVVSENPKVSYDLDKKTNRILRSKAIEEYGHIVYWNFLGQQFRVSSTNEYKAKKGKGKLQYRKTEEQLIEEAKGYISTTTIYKAIMN